MMQRHHHALVASSPHRPYAAMQTGSHNRAPARVADIESSDRRCHNPRNAANTECVCVRLYICTYLYVCTCMCEQQRVDTHTNVVDTHTRARAHTLTVRIISRKSRNNEREREREIRKRRRRYVNTLAFECRRCEWKDNE